MLLDLCHAGDPTGESTISKIPFLKTQYPDMDLIIQSGVGDVEIMRRCIKSGASKFVLKDHITDEIPALLEWQKEFLEEKVTLDSYLIGSSDVVVRLKRELLKLRFENHINVLVEGETGTGKELCAQAIHSGGPFVGVNVSTIPSELFESEFFGSDKGAFTGASNSRPGHFEAAGNGTLFLDEIQSLSPQHQSKLLRVLETKTFMRVGSQVERPMKARIISASNQKLREAGVMVRQRGWLLGEVPRFDLPHAQDQVTSNRSLVDGRGL
jgi:two-component system NtrC family response regulator